MIFSQFNPAPNNFEYLVEHIEYPEDLSRLQAPRLDTENGRLQEAAIERESCEPSEQTDCCGSDAPSAGPGESDTRILTVTSTTPMPPLPLAGHASFPESTLLEAKRSGSLERFGRTWV